MISYFIELVLSIGICILASRKYIFFRGMSNDYWSDKQADILRYIAGCIGIPFVLFFVYTGIFSENRFSDGTAFVGICLVIAQWGSIGIYYMVINIIAWKKKTEILRKNIREAIAENADITDGREMLRICLNENRFHFTQKQIRRNFGKIWNGKD